MFAVFPRQCELELMVGSLVCVMGWAYIYNYAISCGLGQIIPKSSWCNPQSDFYGAYVEICEILIKANSLYF